MKQVWATVAQPRGQAPGRIRSFRKVTDGFVSKSSLEFHYSSYVSLASDGAASRRPPESRALLPPRTPQTPRVRAAARLLSHHMSSHYTRHWACALGALCCLLCSVCGWLGLTAWRATSQNATSKREAREWQRRAKYKSDQVQVARAAHEQLVAQAAKLAEDIKSLARANDSASAVSSRALKLLHAQHANVTALRHVWRAKLHSAQRDLLHAREHTSSLKAELARVKREERQAAALLRAERASADASLARERRALLRLRVRMQHHFAQAVVEVESLLGVAGTGAGGGEAAKGGVGGVGKFVGTHQPQEAQGAQHALLADRYLARWGKPSRMITPSDLDHAERWAADMAGGGARSMLSVAGAWRAKVVSGRLHIKWLFARPTWQERASVLQLLRLAVHKAELEGAPLPDVDLVYVHSDQDPAPSAGWHAPSNQTSGSHRQQSPSQSPSNAARSVAVFTNAIKAKGGTLRASMPVPEFTWLGWGARLPPWCVLSATLLAAALEHPWHRRRDQAFFSGSLHNGRWRARLAALVDEQRKAGKSDLYVHGHASNFVHFRRRVDGTVKRVDELGGTGTGASMAGHQSQSGSGLLPASTASNFKYCLSVPGHGYSSRLRLLLASGCVVIHVRSPWNEFYMPLLKDGVHYVVVDKVEEIPTKLHELRADPAKTASIAANGVHFAHNEYAASRAHMTIRTHTMHTTAHMRASSRFITRGGCTHTPLAHTLTIVHTLA